MESETVERVTEWESEPFSDGHAGLRDLAEREFTGAVTDGGAWLFMLNGRVLGVFDGDVDRFADADGTAYAAPDRSLPLLFAMRETGGDVRGEYYTEETPLSEVDRTLQSGNFTGYVELSENVLSGDYYLAYYGGRRMPVAFIGNQRRRITGDDAFERAADEVGIYRVRTVDLEIVDVPEPATEEAPATGAAAASDEEPTVDDGETTADRGSTADRAVAVDETPATDRGADDAESATDRGAGVAEQSVPDEPAPGGAAEHDESGESDTEGEDPGTESGGSETGTTADTEAAADTGTTADTGSTTDRPADPRASSETNEMGGASATSTRGDSTPEPAETSATGSAESDQSADEPSTREPAAEQADAGGRFEAESDWQGTTTIPALDPAESVSMAPPNADETGEGTGTAVDGLPTEEFAALREERNRLRTRVEELEAETERLGGERDRLERERDEAAATAEELEQELEELRATVDRLETELETTRTELEAAREHVPDGDHELPPEEAMAGTSLFVRYERKGGSTLEDAHNGDAGREAVNDNLRLEHHTEFDDEGAIVDGQPFEEWLRGTIEYGFVEWLTRAFVHDVRETRNQTAMGKLFDAVPDIDRVEFRGTVDLEETTEETEASFDVVVRDRMGQPLIVTDLNDSRDPATEPMLESLIRNATPVAETSDRLAAAFFVTSSYYEPGALETAEEATGGGFLGRGKHKSFVKLSRKDGYHLCLVETRDGEFHISVPEL